MTNSVNEPVRQHLRKVLARLSAHKQALDKQPRRAALPNTAVEVGRDENMASVIADVKRRA
jgi:hypothetical protein